MQIINPSVEIIQIHPTLYEIKNIFTNEFLESCEAVTGYGNRWCMDRPLNRLSLDAQGAEGDWIYNDSGEELCKIIQPLVNQKLKFTTCKWFLDLPRSEVPVHSDADQIAVMVQIYYKSTNTITPGTCFIEPVHHTVEFEPNCGYINLNYLDKKKHLSPFNFNGMRLSIGYQFHFPK